MGTCPEACAGPILSEGEILDHPAAVSVDAAFTIPAPFDLLEADDWGYAIRIMGNPKLNDRIGWLMKRRPGRPPNHVVREYISFTTGQRAGRRPGGAWPR